MAWELCRLPDLPPLEIHFWSKPGICLSDDLWQSSPLPWGHPWILGTSLRRGMSFWWVCRLNASILVEVALSEKEMAGLHSCSATQHRSIRKMRAANPWHSEIQILFQSPERVLECATAQFSSFGTTVRKTARVATTVWWSCRSSRTVPCWLTMLATAVSGETHLLDQLESEWR